MQEQRRLLSLNCKFGLILPTEVHFKIISRSLGSNYIFLFLRIWNLIARTFDGLNLGFLTEQKYHSLKCQRSTTSGCKGICKKVRSVKLQICRKACVMRKSTEKKTSKTKFSDQIPWCCIISQSIRVEN